MTGKPRKRRTLFKLGRRGRRGRVAYDSRWGYNVSRDERSRQEALTSADVPRAIPTTLHPTEVHGTIQTPLHSVHVPDTADGAGDTSDLRTGDIPSENAVSGALEVAALHAEGDIRLPSEDGHALEVNGIHRVEKRRRCREDSESVNEDMEGNVDEFFGSCHGVDFNDGREPNLLDEGVEIMFTDEPVQDTDVVVVDPGLDEQGAIATDLELSSTAVGEARTLSGGEISGKFRKISTWQNLLAVLVGIGIVRFSVEEFEVFRVCINTLLEKGFPNELKLPAYKTITRTLIPLVFSWGFPECFVQETASDSDKAGSRRSANGEQQFEKFIVVKPSAWTLMDVSCPQTWHILKTAATETLSGSASYSFRSISDAPILQNRDAILNICTSGDTTSAEGNAGSNTGTCNDTNWRISCPRNSSLPEDLLSAVDTSAHVNQDVDQDVLMLTVRAIRTALVTSTAMPHPTPERLRDVRNGTLPHITYEKAGFWYVGDYCTVLTSDIEVNYLLCLVHHQAIEHFRSSRIELICVPFAVRARNNEPYCTLQWSGSCKVYASVMTAQPDIGLSLSDSLLFPRRKAATTPVYGRLEDGTGYFVDHVLLYSDGFSQYRYRQGSAGGVYCVSLNYPPHQRRSRERVRVLTVTPPGISTSEGLRSIIEDPVTSSTCGRRVRNADGEETLCFTDVIAYVGDYHEIGPVLDVLGQNGRAPCHLCSFLRFDGHQTSGSQYCSATDTHSGNPCYGRNGPRTTALRGSSMTEDMLASLGLNRSQRAVAKASPLVEYYETLNKKLQSVEIPLAEDKVPVLNPKFDPYRSVLVGPDHLLAGIAINELTLAFKALPTRPRLKEADVAICNSLRTNGLLQHSEIYNFRTSSLHTASISATFCILLVATPILYELVRELHVPEEVSEDESQFLRPIINNVCLFRKLVGRTYWYPIRHVDDPALVADFNSQDGMKHIRGLQHMCVDYLTECNNICKMSPLATAGLDKPDAHRLLELYHHSIPAMGHVRHFSELLFECAHQPLKRAMANSNFRDSHLQTMKHTIGDDWKGRVEASLHVEGGDPQKGIDSILNALCGREEEVRSYVARDETLQERTLQLLSNDIMRSMIRSVPRHMECGAFTTEWRLMNLSNPSTPHPDYQKLIDDALLNTDLRHAKAFDKAKRLKVWNNGTSETRSHARDHDTLTAGNAVQALVANVRSSLLTPCSTDPTEDMNMYFISFFAIEALVHTSNELGYAVVRRCVVTNNQLLHIDERSELQLLQLSDSVRRVCIVHTCNADKSLRCVQSHLGPGSGNASMLNRNLFHFFHRQGGYPPRMA